MSPAVRHQEVSRHDRKPRVPANGLTTPPDSTTWRAASTLRVSTDRYRSREYADRERDAIWLKTWQVAGRVDDLPKVGDWMEYKIYDQSFLIVRGKGRERAISTRAYTAATLSARAAPATPSAASCASTTCGPTTSTRLKGLLREESSGGLDKSDNSLIAVSVDTFGGFIFINPDPGAQPLVEWIGEDALAILAPYHLELMSTVMNVSEPLDCNWKVVMDAFNEGYHVNGVHPQLLAVLNIQPETTRYNFYENHSIAMAPSRWSGPPLKKQVEGTSHCRDLPGTVAVIPRFTELVKEYTAEDGSIDFPEGSRRARCSSRRPAPT